MGSRLTWIESHDISEPIGFSLAQDANWPINCFPMNINEFTIEGETILGPVGLGVSNSVYLLAKDGLIYVSKARFLNPSVHYTPANEMLGSLLAKYLKLPIPEFKRIKHIGENFFGSELHKAFTFDPRSAKLPYGEVLASVFVFDVWICNVDRHLGNFLYIETLTDRPALKIIDHGHAFWGDASRGDFEALRQKASRTDISDFVKADVYRKYVKNFDAFSSMLEKIRCIPAEDLLERVNINLWLDKEEKRQVFDLLWERKDKLADLLYQNRALFDLS